MHKYLFICLLTFCLGSCNNSPDPDKEEITGTVMEIAPSSEELNEIALLEQPQVIQDFFELDQELLGDDFCYDRESLVQLILYGNDSSHTWSKFEVSDNYLTAYHQECEVLLEFMTFYFESSKKGFLSQMNRSNQQFDCLEWNEHHQEWMPFYDYPKPAMDDYFQGLSPAEAELVQSYGFDFAYINPLEENVTYVFSEWTMQLNLGEKELLEFNHSPAFDFELTHDENTFKIEPISIATAIAQSNKFMIGYSQTAVPSADFEQKYQTILAAFKPGEINAQLAHYGANNFDVYFPQDTFNLSYMEQFELRNGFWFYAYGKEPLDLGGEESTTEIIRQATAYFSGSGDVLP